MNDDSLFNERIARLVNTARTDADYRRINEMLSAGPQGFADGGDVRADREARLSKARERMDKFKREVPSVMNLYNWALSEAEDMYPFERDVTKRDAARHMLASAIMARKTTPGIAEGIGMAYELKEAPFRTMGHWLGLSKPRPDYPTDTFNNALGASLAEYGDRPEELRKAVREAIDKGRARLQPDEVQGMGYADGGVVGPIGVGYPQGELAVGYAQGGEAQKESSARKQLEALDRVGGRIVDEKLRETADSPRYADLVGFLADRRVMPEIKYQPGVSGEFISGWGMPNRGEIGIGMSATPGTVIHELTHAADRQISQQYYDLAKKRKLNPLEKQFVQTYERLVFSPELSHKDPEKYPRVAMAERLAPEWAKKERDYRSTPGEMVAFGMGRFVDEEQRYRPGNTAPPHVDPTMATEFSVLLDIAKRLQKSKPVTDKR